MKRGILICFTGIDGSGKTTCANLVAGTLREKYRLETRYTWAKFGASIFNPLMTVVKKMLSFSTNNPHTYPECFSSGIPFDNQLLSKVYLCFLLIEHFTQIFVKVKLPLMLGTNVICDRYIYDTIVDLSLSCKFAKNCSNMLKSYSYLIPKPNLVFLIDLPEEIAYGRKYDTPSIAYLSKRRELYLNMAEEYGMVVLDGSKDLKELSSVILNYVEREVLK